VPLAWQGLRFEPRSRDRMVDIGSGGLRRGVGVLFPASEDLAPPPGGDVLQLRGESRGEGRRPAFEGKEGGYWHPPPPPGEGGAYLCRHRAGMGKIGIWRGFKEGETETSFRYLKKRNEIFQNKSKGERKMRHKNARRVYQRPFTLYSNRSKSHVILELLQNQKQS